MSERFAKAIENLLTGMVICETVDERLFRYLSSDENRNEVTNFLHRVGRTLLQTKDQYGYYCAYQDIDTPQNFTAIRHQFEHSVMDMEGLILWLRLARSSSNESRPLVAGDLLKESELLHAIEESSALQAQLDDVAHKLKVARTTQVSKQKLRQVLDFLTKKDYLKSLSGGGSTYRATAKWSLLYDQLEYIQQHEGIEESNLSNQQREIFDGKD